MKKSMLGNTQYFKQICIKRENRFCILRMQQSLEKKAHQNKCKEIVMVLFNLLPAHLNFNNIPLPQYNKKVE